MNVISFQRATRRSTGALSLELQRVEVIVDLLCTFAEIFKDPEVPDPDSDESMREETRSERLRRYQNAEQGEVSDPDAWAVLHYGRPPAESADEETTEELQEF